MKEILIDDYDKVFGLLDKGMQYPEVIAVLENNNPGRVFVDDVRAPKMALVWNEGMAGFYFIGDNRSERFLKTIHTFIDKELSFFLRKKDLKTLEVSATTVEWNRTIETLFNSSKLDCWGQCIYTWDKNITFGKEQAISKFKIYDLKDEQINFKEYRNWKHYDHTLRTFWGDIETQINKMTCYYAVEGEIIIGMCYSGFTTSGTKVIGIETEEAYRKKGVGYALAQRCIEDILKEDKKPYWDCMKKNIASRKLAEKLGFIKSREYICYSAKLD